MSIANEITRLLSAKADITKILEEKALTVPQDFKLNDAAELIANLANTSDDTVTAEALAEGYTAHDKNGVLITGTMIPRSEFSVTDDGDGNVVLITSDLLITDSGNGNIAVLQRSV